MQPGEVEAHRFMLLALHIVTLAPNWPSFYPVNAGKVLLWADFPLSRTKRDQNQQKQSHQKLERWRCQFIFTSGSPQSVCALPPVLIFSQRPIFLTRGGPQERHVSPFEVLPTCLFICSAYVGDSTCTLASSGFIIQFLHPCSSRTAALPVTGQSGVQHVQLWIDMLTSCNFLHIKKCI